MREKDKLLRECRAVLLCHHRHTHKLLIERINKALKNDPR